MPESFGEQAERPLLGIDFVFEMGMKKIEEQVKEIDALDLKIAVFSVSWVLCWLRSWPSYSQQSSTEQMIWVTG